MKTLADAFCHPELVSTLPSEEIPELLAELESVRARLWARLTVSNGVRTERMQPDRRLNVEETAAKLGISKDKLYRCADSFPFTIRMGRSLGFSEQGIDRWLRSNAGAKMP